MAAANDVLTNKRVEEAFDFIRYHVSKIEKLYNNQMRLIKALCNGSNVFFDTILVYNVDL